MLKKNNKNSSLWKDDPKWLLHPQPVVLPLWFWFSTIHTKETKKWRFVAPAAVLFLSLASPRPSPNSGIGRIWRPGTASLDSEAQEFHWWRLNTKPKPTKRWQTKKKNKSVTLNLNCYLRNIVNVFSANHLKWQIYCLCLVYVFVT